MVEFVVPVSRPDVGGAVDAAVVADAEVDAGVVADVDAVFHALADRTRRDVVERLRGGEATVSDLARPHPMSLAAFVKHLAVLESAGLVRSTKKGRTRWCRLAPAALLPAEEWMRVYGELWTGRLDALERHLEEHP